MALLPMELIGYTAGFDALVALVSWQIVQSHQKKNAGPPSQVVEAFKSYLMWTVTFLALTAIAMLWLTGPIQMWVVFLSDLTLWVALAYFIRLALVDRPSANRMMIMGLFVVLAAAGTLYQLASLLGMSLTFGPSLTYVLTNMAPILMYLVWIPSALLFFIQAGQTQNSALRTRLMLLGAGLLLMTFSWAWRLLTANPSIYLVIIVSLLGFISVLAGILRRA